MADITPLYTSPTPSPFCCIGISAPCLPYRGSVHCRGRRHGSARDRPLHRPLGRARKITRNSGNIPPHDTDRGCRSSHDSRFYCDRNHRGVLCLPERWAVPRVSDLASVLAFRVAQGVMRWTDHRAAQRNRARKTVAQPWREAGPLRTRVQLAVAGTHRTAGAAGRFRMAAKLCRAGLMNAVNQERRCSASAAATAGI